MQEQRSHYTSVISVPEPQDLLKVKAILSCLISEVAEGTNCQSKPLSIVSNALLVRPYCCWTNQKPFKVRKHNDLSYIQWDTLSRMDLKKKIILPWWPIARHKPLSLFLMAVGGDKTNCVSVSRLKHCTECRIQEAETVGGNIDDWDLSAWNTKKHPTLYNCLKMNSNLKRRSREEDGEPLKKLSCSDPADTGKLCVYLLQGVVLWKLTDQNTKDQ